MTLKVQTRRPAPAVSKAKTPARPAPKRAPDSSFAPAKKQSVVLKPVENPALLKAEMLKKVQSFVQQAATASPPMNREQLSVAFTEALTGKGSLTPPAREALNDLARGGFQIGMARSEVANGNPDIARTYLDQPLVPSQIENTYAGAIAYRDQATRSGELSPADVAPLALAIIDVTVSSLGALSPEQGKLNSEASDALKQGEAVKDFFLSKNKVMSQGGGVQAANEKVIQYSNELRLALSLPLSAPNRDQAVREATASLKSYLVVTGTPEQLDAGRLSVIDGLTKIGDVATNIPTPMTRAFGGVMKEVAAGLQYAAGDISGEQLALTTASNLIDVVGGQAAQKLKGVGKVAVDASLEFSKTFFEEMGKIDSKLPPAEQQKLRMKAATTAAYNTISSRLKEVLGGDVSANVVDTIARAFVNGVTSGMTKGVWDAATKPGLSPQERQALLKDAVWKGSMEAVKAASEFALGLGK